jgi:hypothetical protein
MAFRADGASVVRSADDGEDVGVALAYTPNMASRIADALNESRSSADLRLRTDPLTGGRVAGLDVADRTPLRDVLGEGRYVRVTGPYVTAETNTPGGRQILGFAAGAVLPGDATAGHARHLVDVGLAQVVEAPSSEQAMEGAPTERHRLESAALQPGPTVGRPAPGTVAGDYERDPEAAARAVYGPAPGRVADEDADRPPPQNAPKADWVDYAASHGMARDEAEATSKEQLVGRVSRR